MSVGPASSRGSSVSEQDAAARRAAEEARRAAEAARRAAEAARKAEEAQKAAEAARKSNTAFEDKPRQAEFDNRLGAEPPATSLLTEDAHDGQVNCLDVAADWANKATPELRARSEMIFLEDTRPGEEGQSGHVVVRQGEKVFDPTTKKTYESMDAYKKEQPHYQEAGRLSANHVKKILDAPSGSPERADALARAKVSPALQKMMVADENDLPPLNLTYPLGPATPEDAAKARKTTEDKQQVSEKLLQQATGDEKKAKDAEDRRDKAQKKLNDANQELTSAFEERKRVAERPAPKPGDAERLKVLDQKVKDARKKVEAAEPGATQAANDAKTARDTANESKRKALAAANETVQAAKDANSKASRAGQAPPFPVADKVKDAFDAQGKLAPEEQTALLGAPTLATSEGQARADMQWMDQVVERRNAPFGLFPQPDHIRPEMDTPAAHDKNRRKLADLLEANPDPAYQKEVLALARPWLEASIGCNGYRKDGGDAQMREFAEMAKGLTPENRKTLLEGIAAGANSASDLKASGNAEFDVGLLNELQRTNKSTEASKLSTSMTEKMEKARERFTDAKDKVKKLNEQLTALTASFGKTVTPEQLENAIATFKERHKDEYAEFEKAAEGLTESVKTSSKLLEQGTDSLQPSLVEETRNIVKELGTYAQSEAGQKLFDDSITAQAEGKPSQIQGILSSLANPDFVKTIGKDVLGDISKGTTTALTKRLAQRVLALSMDPGGEPKLTEDQLKARKAEAQRLFKDVLTKNAPLFGVNEQAMKELQEPFDQLLKGDAGADEKFKAAIKKVEVQAAGATDLKGLGSLRGLAVVAGVIGASKDGAGIAKDFTSDGKIDSVAMMGKFTKLLGDTTSTVGDGSMLVLDVLKHAKNNPELGEKAGKVLGKLGPIGGVAGAVGDFIGSIDAFADGKPLEGTAKGLTAAGGALLSAAALSNVVPVWGQIAGGALFAIGTGINIYANWKEGKVDEADTKAFLKAAGMPPKLAEEFKDPEDAAKAGQFLGQLAERTKLSPVELQQKLASLNDEQIGALARAVDKTKMKNNSYVGSDNDNGAYKLTPSRMGPALTSLGSLDDAINFLHSKGVIVDRDVSGYPV
ncbi:hypothetical protein ACLESO_00200 [Pyxidicoccus sp. 3LG]